MHTHTPRGLTRSAPAPAVRTQTRAPCRAPSRCACTTRTPFTHIPARPAPGTRCPTKHNPAAALVRAQAGGAGPAVPDHFAVPVLPSKPCATGLGPCINAGQGDAAHRSAALELPSWCPARLSLPQRVLLLAQQMLGTLGRCCLFQSTAKLQPPQLQQQPQALGGCGRSGQGAAPRAGAGTGPGASGACPGAGRVAGRKCLVLGEGPGGSRLIKPRAGGRCLEVPRGWNAARSREMDWGAGDRAWGGQGLPRRLPASRSPPPCAGGGPLGGSPRVLAGVSP